MAVPQQAAHAVIGQARRIIVRMAKMADNIGAGHHMIQTGFSGDPDAAIAVISNRSDADMAQALGTYGVDDKPLVLPVITGKPTRRGANPQDAARIRQQGLDEIIGKFAGLTGVGPVDAEMVAVPAGQAIL